MIEKYLQPVKRVRPEKQALSHVQQTIRWQQKRVSLGLCITCGDKTIDGYGNKYCKKHQDYVRLYARKYYQRKKERG